jgi:hypothetical protein
VEFAQSQPDLAAVAERLLHQYGAGLAFLAMIRLDGGRRFHPVCPVLAESGLYPFGTATSPKRADLLRDGRYVPHTICRLRRTRNASVVATPRS